MALIKNKIFYAYNDVTIIPNILSNIEHRSECIPLNDDGMLPLFTAPMDTVVNSDNFYAFENEMINAILPRTEDLELRVSYSIRGRWAAYSLTEFKSKFCDEEKKIISTQPIKALIDVANGHMAKILELVRGAKNIYGDNIIIMAGNIANPRTYEEYAKVGVDYCRVSVGSGFCCLSSTQLGVHYPMASLIDDIIEVKNEMKGIERSRKNNKLTPMYKTFPKIIADGGTRNYCDIIKALALGADYVMCGSIFSKMLESAPKKECESLGNGITLNDISNIHKKDDDQWYGVYNGNEMLLGQLSCKIYGMASKEGQIALNGCKTKTSEGKSKRVLVEYTMHGWTMNFIDYLRSAMSYVGVKTIDEFKTNSIVIINSQNAVSAVNK